MISTEVKRTLVKSAPELWSELSDPEALVRYLGDFGEIRITRTEAEKRVEWETDQASGSVQLAASGWGTKVTLTVNRQPPEAWLGELQEEASETSEVLEQDPPEQDPTPPAVDEHIEQPAAETVKDPPQAQQPPIQDTTPPDEQPAAQAPQPEPTPDPQDTTQPPTENAAEPEPDTLKLGAQLAELEAQMTEESIAVLSAVLDRLGAAHHRPFSRG